MPRKSFLQKELNKKKRQIKRSARRRYEAARDTAQQTVLNATGRAGQATWNAVRHPVTTAQNLERNANQRMTQFYRSPVGRGVTRADKVAEGIVKAPFKAAGRVVGAIKVKSYVKSDGTRVKGHDRSKGGQ